MVRLGTLVGTFFSVCISEYEVLELSNFYGFIRRLVNSEPLLYYSIKFPLLLYKCSADFGILPPGLAMSLARSWIDSLPECPLQEHNVRPHRTGSKNIIKNLCERFWIEPFHGHILPFDVLPGPCPKKSDTYHVGSENIGKDIATNRQYCGF